MYEKTFEKYVCEKIKKLGGRAFKWVCPGVSGVPDRICILPEGKIFFIEVKRPDGNYGRRERQKKIHQVLLSLGCSVFTIDSKEGFIKTLEELGYEI